MRGCGEGWVRGCGDLKKGIGFGSPGQPWCLSLPPPALLPSWLFGIHQGMLLYYPNGQLGTPSACFPVLTSKFPGLGELWWYQHREWKASCLILLTYKWGLDFIIHNHWYLNLSKFIKYISNERSENFLFSFIHRCLPTPFSKNLIQRSYWCLEKGHSCQYFDSNNNKYCFYPPK